MSHFQREREKEREKERERERGRERERDRQTDKIIMKRNREMGGSIDATKMTMCFGS